jgi:uncharacterized tellurite resistance protein B-like protein
MTGLCSVDKITYLANVFAICGADGRFVPQEVEVLKDITQRLGVTQEEAAAARRLVARGHFEFALLSENRARRDNLEDMVMAALADGVLDEKESKPIEKMAKALRFAQADMDKVSAHAQLRLDLMRKARRPPAGQATQKMPPLSAARPAPLSSAVRPAPSAPVQKAAGPDARYGEARLEQAPAAPSAPEPPVADAPPPPPSPPPSPPPPPHVVRHQTVEACMCCRAASADPQGYCFGDGETSNVWGCRLLCQPWCAGAAWLSAGTFRPSGCFVFDRRAVRALLAEGLALAAGCPHLDPAYVAQALAALPSRAWPGRRWTLRRPADGEQGLVLTVRRHHHGCVLHTKQAVVGVEPAGGALARRVIRDACRAAGRGMPESVFGTGE